jgi:hypothetical protein
MQHFFTLEEARLCLPELERTVRAAVQAKTYYDQSEEALHSLLHRITMSGGMMVDRFAVETIKSTRHSNGERMKSAVEEIQEMGCLIKDLETGLIDFPTLLRGEEVYLCWRLGETDIGFWHGVHEGVAGRRAIDQFFVDNHQGSAPN